MKRGQGYVQQTLLARIAAADGDGLLDTFDLAAAVYDTNRLTEAQLVAVRRALKGLAKAGLIADLGKSGWQNGRSRWATHEAAAAHDREMAKIRAVARHMGMGR